MADQLKQACLDKLAVLAAPVIDELDQLRKERDELVDSIRPVQDKIRELGERIKTVSPKAAEYQQMKVELHRKHKRIGNMPTPVDLIAERLGVE